MIPSDTELVLLQQASYGSAPAGQIIDSGPDRVVITHQPDYTVVTVRGTVNPAGWWSDFQFGPKMARAHPALGVCEDGFLAGAEALAPAVADRVATGVPLILQGHSRGAGIAPILAGLMLVAGLVPARVVCWEKPWCNGAQLRSILEARGVPGQEYWHGDDPVPLVPAVSWLVMANFQIKHFGKWMLDPFDCHGIDGIVQDVQAGVVR
jgi:hypothetical protein